jgi:hypothetical protein
MKSSFHSLIPFLPLFCSCQFRRLDSIQFLCSQAHILAGWSPETRLFISLYAAENFFVTTLHGPRRKQLSIVEKACLLIRCLAMGLYVTIFIYSWLFYLLLRAIATFPERGSLRGKHRLIFINPGLNTSHIWLQLFLYSYWSIHIRWR